MKSKSVFENADGSVTHFTRDDCAHTGEDLRLAPDGTFISRTIYRYDSRDRMQEYATYDEEDVEVTRVTMRYGPGPWDAQSVEFGAGGMLLRCVQHSFDDNNNCKTRSYYGPAGEYLGKALEKVDEDGVFREPRYYDSVGNRVQSEPR